MKELEKKGFCIHSLARNKIQLKSFFGISPSISEETHLGLPQAFLPPRDWRVWLLFIRLMVEDMQGNYADALSKGKGSNITVRLPIANSTIDQVIKYVLQFSNLKE